MGSTSSITGHLGSPGASTRCVDCTVLGARLGLDSKSEGPSISCGPGGATAEQSCTGSLRFQRERKKIPRTNPPVAAPIARAVIAPFHRPSRPQALVRGLPRLIICLTMEQGSVGEGTEELSLSSNYTCKTLYTKHRTSPPLWTRMWLSESCRRALAGNIHSWVSIPCNYSPCQSNCVHSRECR